MLSRLRVVAVIGVLVTGACSLAIPFEDLTSEREAIVDAGLDTHVADAQDADADAQVDADAQAEAEADAQADADADVNTCLDKVQNGDETDTDCGGSCARCSSGRKCKDGGDCISGTCESLKCTFCPAGMIRVPVGTSAYCIDPTEVTVDQYKSFSSKVMPNGIALPNACKWKTSFGAGGSLPSGSTPVRNVDWCDAWAYCTWMDRRLCGAIGSSTQKNPTPFDKSDDPNVSQWRHACSYGSSPTWPYGGTADPTKCNTADRLSAEAGVASVVPVRSLAACIGSSPELNGLYDMSGNVAEWEDSCGASTGQTDACRVRGGSFKEDAADATCGAPTTRNRSDRQDWVGFRCCKY